MHAPEASIGLDRWRAELARIIREYAGRHGVAVQGLSGVGLED
jgi:hypothetical protein